MTTIFLGCSAPYQQYYNPIHNIHVNLKKNVITGDYPNGHLKHRYCGRVVSHPVIAIGIIRVFPRDIHSAGYNLPVIQL